VAREKRDRKQKRGPDKVTRKPTKETVPRKRRFSQRADEEPVSEEDDEVSSGVGARKGWGSSKRLKTLETVRPPE
jgi:hypothetical protein